MFGSIEGAIKCCPSHICSRYHACFRRRRGSAPLSEVMQKLSPSCILAWWLEHIFEQCRNTVKMKAWFLHLACHSELPMLVGRGFIPSAFPWYQHLRIQLCSAPKWLAYALALHRPPCSASPHFACQQTCILLQDLRPRTQTH